MTDYCVYFYVREDGTPYYVGIGKKKRPFAKHAHRSHNIDFKPKNDKQILIIHEDITNEEAKKLEIEYISKYKRKCDGGILINLTLGGDGRNGDKASEDARKKMSEIGKENAKYGSKNPASRSILVYDKDGNYIAKYETAREAAKALNIGQCWKHIPAVCKGDRKHTCGYVFKYE